MLTNRVCALENIEGASDFGEIDPAFKCYLSDTGLLVSLAFSNRPYLENELYRAVDVYKRQGESGTASLNVQDVTSADRSDELALVIAEADNIVRSGNDLVVLGPDGKPINNPEDRLGVSIVDGDEQIATGYYCLLYTSRRVSVRFRVKMTGSGI